jgi:hypothetical protein
MPIVSSDADAAALVLRLLLDDDAPTPAAIDWSAVAGIARRDGVEQRLAAVLARRGVPLPERFADAVRRSRERTDRLLALAVRLTDACERRGLPHVFLSLAQHVPDVGREVDVLLGATTPDADRAILDQIPAVPGYRRLRGRLAGRNIYPLSQLGASLEVHHGRLGRLGEHTRVGDLVLRRRRPGRVGPALLPLPSPEDQLLLQALWQSCGRRSLRLRDAHWTIAALRAQRPDWTALLATAETLGLIPGLSCHLDFVDQIHARLTGRPLLDGTIRERLGRRPWGRIAFRQGSFRFPTARVTGRLYLAQLRAEVAAGDWEAAGRLLLLPLIAVPAAWRRLARAGAGGA